MANREQSGVLELQRKQSVIASLAEYFSSMRLYRKQQGRVMLELIHNYLSDGRLIRIIGKQGEQYIPLWKQSEGKYDVVVDEAPTSPDQRMKTWYTIGELLPMAMQAGIPVPPEVLDYAPLPQDLAQKWKEQLTQKTQVPPQVQQQLQQLQQENQQLKSKQQEKMVELQGKQQDSQADLMLNKQKMEMDFAMRQAEMQQEMQLQREKFQQEMQLETEKARMELQLEAEKFQAQMQLAQQKQASDYVLKQQSADKKFAIEREGRKINSISSEDGTRYVVERDLDGNLMGLRAESLQ